MKTLAWMAIPLSRGLYTLVDRGDFERLSKYKWCIQKGKNTYYAVRYISIQNGKQRLVRMHRAIMDIPVDMEIDHKNGCGLDNRKQNLRPATHRQNIRNQRRQNRKKTSQYKGVYWYERDKKWMALIGFNYKRYYLGCFVDEVEAAKVYDTKARELFGEFARTNF